MNVTFRNVSKVRKGTLTDIKIKIKSVEDHELFFELMVKYRSDKTGFNWLIPSKINYKYYTRMNIEDTCDLFEKFRKEYREKVRKKKNDKK